MALDPLLFDTYKRYKAGTNRVTTWLASKAQETKSLDDLVQIAHKNKSKGRPKGKARAAQKEKGLTHQVRLADIPGIAKAIASTMKEKVPETIIRTLEEVIAARSACSECFKSSILFSIRRVAIAL
jgi:hypothetical protein